MKYRKKPIVIDAIQLISEQKSIRKVLEFMGQSIANDFITQEKFYEYCNNVISNGLIIPTLEGDMRASIGDYIIKGVNEEFYPCKPDIFGKTYEKVTQ